LALGVSAVHGGEACPWAGFGPDWTLAVTWAVLRRETPPPERGDDAEKSEARLIPACLPDNRKDLLMNPELNREYPNRARPS